MPPVKPLDKISKKWVRVSGQSQESYREGIESTTKDWADATANAEGNYEAGVTAAIAQKRFSKGVRDAGTAKWKTNALAKGPARFGEGVRLAENAYREGFQPYREVILNTTLPERLPKGDPGNIDRVRIMAQALHDKKVELSAG